MKKLTKLEKNWIFYDVGNSAFTLLVTTILPIYFSSLAESGGLTNQEYLSYWGYAVTVSTLIVALLGPLLGTIADGKDKRKKLFLLSLIIGLAGSLSFPIWQSWLLFLIAFVISKVGYNGSLIFYDSMLIDITEEERFDQVSSYGFAWGYIGSCIPFVLSLVCILVLPGLGLPTKIAMTLAFAINGAWWLLWSIPLLKTYQQKYYRQGEKEPISENFRRLYTTLKNLKNQPTVFFFLLAFFFYIDGVYTIINMATAYGESLGLDSKGLLLALLVTQLVAFPASLTFSKLSKTISTSKLISFAIFAYGLIALFAVQLDQLWEFWVLAIFVGLFQGGIQALSRSYFAKIIPKEQSGEYFGLYDIFGKGASILGTFLVSFITQITGNQSYAIFSMVVLFAIGFILFRKSSKLMDKEI